LIAAVELLLEDKTLPPIRLRVAGYLGEGDKPYFAALAARARAHRAADRFEFLGEVSLAEKIAFLQSLDVMSVPTVYRESKGLSILEALANGVAVVLPSHGAFPEMVADTGGGLLCEPRNPAALAGALAQLAQNPAQAAQLGQRGKQAVHARYHAAAMAAKTLELYRQVRARFDSAAAR
jgi:glycosyltransferase involved in cell wall biosynthesis